MDVMEETLNDHVQRASEQRDRSESIASRNSLNIQSKTQAYDKNMDQSADLREEIQAIKEKQKDLHHRFKRDMATVKQLLIQVCVWLC